MSRSEGKCPHCGSGDLVVTHYKHNHSAFNGYHWTASDYSAVQCQSCQWWWRTKAKYVEGLKLDDQDS